VPPHYLGACKHDRPEGGLSPQPAIQQTDVPPAGEFQSLRNCGRPNRSPAKNLPGRSGSRCR
jgi:hypothetical protein